MYTEMPQYKCHKKVWALKIKKVVLDYEEAKKEGRETDGGATLFFENKGYAPKKVSASYVRKHNPKAPGYYVVYKGGYDSWSPVEEFEDGYTEIVKG